MIKIRKCSICGKRIRFNVDSKGKYDNGHFFGLMKIPVEGTGEWKKKKKDRFGKHWFTVVSDWTGKEKKFEYWECNKCFKEAEYHGWLEDTIERLYGKRCPDYDKDCALCQAWSVYDTIIQDSNGTL